MTIFFFINAGLCCNKSRTAIYLFFFKTSRVLGVRNRNPSHISRSDTAKNVPISLFLVDTNAACEFFQQLPVFLVAKRVVQFCTSEFERADLRPLSRLFIRRNLACKRVSGVAESNDGRSRLMRFFRCLLITSTSTACNVERQQQIIQIRQSSFLHRVVHSINQVCPARE